ncbi:MAG: hypothetical protein M1814_001765 [Vezdaea aestivalis]|nr:MAG: hypothetical protein M1814_001765 [Vezdaea aestivalis]
MAIQTPVQYSELGSNGYPPPPSPTHSLKRKIDSITPDKHRDDPVDTNDFAIAQAVIAPLQIRRYNSTSIGSSRTGRSKSPNISKKPRKSASISDFGQVGFLSARAFDNRGKSTISTTSTTLSDAKTESTTPSISKFPRPPSIVADQLSPIFQEHLFDQLPSTAYSPPLKSHHRPSFRRGSSHDAFGSQTSIDFARTHALRRLNRLSEDSNSIHMAEHGSPADKVAEARQGTPSIDSNTSGKDTPPSRALFEDLPTAHSSILRVTNSKWKVTSRSAFDSQTPLRPTILRPKASAPALYTLAADRPDSPLIHPTLSPFETVNTEPGINQTEEGTNSWKDKISNILRRSSKSPLAHTGDLESQTEVPMTPLSPRPTVYHDSRPSISTSQHFNNSFDGAEGTFALNQSINSMAQNENSLSPDALAYFQQQGLYRPPQEDSDQNFEVLDLQTQVDRNLSARSTVGSVLKHYGQRDTVHGYSSSALKIPGEQYDDDSQERPKTSHSAASRATSRFSQFDFGIGSSKKEPRSSLNDVNSHSSGSIKRSSRQGEGREHQSKAWQTQPLFGNSKFAMQDTQKRSSQQPDLDIGQSLQPHRPSDRPSSSGKSSSGALTDLNDKDLNSGSRKSGLLVTGRSRPGVSRNGSSRGSRISALSKTSSEAVRAVALEREISDELRRISRLSGMSRVSGTVLVYNDGLVTESPIAEPVHGHSTVPARPSNSYPERSDRLVPTEDATEDSEEQTQPVQSSTWKGKARVVENEHEQPRRYPTFIQNLATRLRSDSTEFKGPEDDADWETVKGSRAFSRSLFPSRAGLVRDATGSSIADFSDEEDDDFLQQHRRSHYDDQTRYPLSPLPEILQHPADDRFKHSYRLAEVAPEQEPILLPAYDFSNAARFPNRNAMTSPVSSEVYVDKTYKHPKALPEDHINPFHHSPTLGQSRASSTFDDHVPMDNGVAYIEADSPSVYRSKGAFSREESMRQQAVANHAVFNQRSSHGKDAIGGSFHSSVWMDTFGDLGSEIGDESEAPSRNNSFSKVTVLGPKFNITGTPGGTNMREVGSSLADISSPGPVWTSSPNYGLTPCHLELSAKATPIRSPPPAHLGLESPESPSPTRDSPLVTQIRAQRDQLAADGLLPRPHKAHLQPRSAGHVRGESERPFLNLSISEDPRSYTQTPPVPRTFEPFILEHAHLQRHPRDDSSHGLILWKRKKNISRVVLCICMLFPPMLLLYGYGFMDNVMISLSHGEISRFGRTEKRLALLLGWGLGLCAIVGIIIGMVIVGLGAK